MYWELDVKLTLVGEKLQNMITENWESKLKPETNSNLIWKSCCPFSTDVCSGYPKIHTEKLKLQKAHYFKAPAMDIFSTLWGMFRAAWLT